MKKILHAEGLGTQLRRLLELLDGDLEDIYRHDGLGYRPRYTPVMKALAPGKPLTIKDIAQQSSISHSAASQTVTKMVKAGLVSQSSSGDGRERPVSLTRRGKRMIPLLKVRWQATQQAADELDEELETPLSSTLAAAISALMERSFQQRIEDAEKRIEKIA